MKIFTSFLILAGLFFWVGCSGPYESSDVGEDGNNAIVGSYSTMLTLGDRLYAVTKNEIVTFDVSDPKKPKKLDKKDIGVDIESLYYYDGLLFIGSANNMYIYSLNDSGIPERESITQYNEIWRDEVCSSDPIVVRNNIAYVTLSTTLTGRCFNRIVNELRVYNVEDYNSPVFISALQMTNPKGLTFGKEKLYVCDANQGLVVFDLTDPLNPVREKIFEGYKAFDVIVKNDLLIVSSEKSLYQYNISDENNIQFYSKINL